MSARALLVLSVLVSVATPQSLEIDLTSGSGSAQWTAPYGPWSLETTRARFTAEERTWCDLLVGARVLGSTANVPLWLHPQADVDPSTVPLPASQSYWNGPSTPSLRIAPTTFATSFTNGLEAYFAAGASPSACQDWYVPILESGTPTLTNGMRVWDSRPLVWLSQSVGTALGVYNSASWDGVMVSTGGDAPADTTLMSTEALFKRACIAQAVAAGAGEAAANDFFNSSTYLEAAAQGNLEVRLQGMLATSTDPTILNPGSNDLNAPNLSGHPVWHPSTKLTNCIGIIVLLPPATEGIPGLDGAVAAGELRQFELPGAVPPVQVMFPVSGAGGSVTVSAFADGDVERPVRYKVSIPQDVTTGTVFVSTGSGSGYQAVGSITEVTQK